MASDGDGLGRSRLPSSVLAYGGSRGMLAQQRQSDVDDVVEEVNPFKADSGMTDWYERLMSRLQRLESNRVGIGVAGCGTQAAMLAPQPQQAFDACSGDHGGGVVRASWGSLGSAGSAPPQLPTSARSDYYATELSAQWRPATQTAWASDPFAQAPERPLASATMSERRVTPLGAVGVPTVFDRDAGGKLLSQLPSRGERRERHLGSREGLWPSDESIGFEELATNDS